MYNTKAKQVFEMGVKKACEDNGVGVIYFNELKQNEGIDLKIIDLQEISEMVSTDKRTENLTITAYSLAITLKDNDRAKLLTYIDEEWKQLIHDLYEALGQVEAGYQSPYFGEIEIKLQIRDYIKDNIDELTDECVKELLDNEVGVLTQIYDRLDIQTLLDNLMENISCRLG